MELRCDRDEYEMQMAVVLCKIYAPKKLAVSQCNAVKSGGYYFNGTGKECSRSS